MTYRSVFACPYPDFIECFFATASRTVHELPDRLVKGKWKVWLYGPDMVKEILKVIIFHGVSCYFSNSLLIQNGSFSASDAKLLKMSLTGPSEPEPPKKRKTRDPSLPALSSQAGNFNG